jgi:hypothetical protein
MKLQIIKINNTIDFGLIKNHPYHSIPAGQKLRMEFLHNNIRIGTMYWVKPSYMTESQNTVLELKHICFVKNVPFDLKLKAIKMARKYIRKHLRFINGLITVCKEEEIITNKLFSNDNWFPILQHMIPQVTKSDDIWDGYTVEKTLARTP